MKRTFSIYPCAPETGLLTGDRIRERAADPMSAAILAGLTPDGRRGNLPYFVAVWVGHHGESMHQMFWPNGSSINR